MKRLLFLFLPLSFASTLYGQTFLNGSFENNTALNCMFDINNATFNTVMTNVKGIGELQTLDIFSFNNCPGFNAAQSGNFFVSLENTSDSTKSTAISLKLSDTLQIGNTYSFCFYDRGISPGVGPIEIGICNNDSSFGSVIYTSPPANTVWTQRTVSFTAPLTGSYITARYKHGPPPYNGILIDNFGICLGTGINDTFSNENIYQIFPNPTTTELNIQLTQNSSDLQFIRILSSHGQELFKSENTNKINVASFANGFYILEIRIFNKSYFSKFLKQ